MKLLLIISCHNSGSEESLLTLYGRIGARGGLLPLTYARTFCLVFWSTYNHGKTIGLYHFRRPSNPRQKAKNHYLFYYLQSYIVEFQVLDTPPLF
jgi:hypothetical protein